MMSIPLNEKTMVSISLVFLATFAGFVFWMGTIYTQAHQSLDLITQLSARVSNLETAKEDTSQTLVGVSKDITYIKISLDDIKKALADRHLPQS